MIKSKLLWDFLKQKGYYFFSGVPCNILRGMLGAMLKDKSIEYIPAVREDNALGIASGAYLTGKKSGILIQNSGLGNIINTLTSFNLIYRIPVLMFITWRGRGRRDAPQHLIMGKKMFVLLRELKVPFVILTDDYRKDIRLAISKMKRYSVPVAVIIKNKLIS